MSAFPESGRGRTTDTAIVAAAALASVALVHLAAGTATVTLAFAGGLVVFGLVAFAAARAARAR